MQPDNSFAAKATALLIDISLRSLVLILLAGLICYLVRRGSAASRHAVWMLTLTGLLLLPALRTLVPPLTVHGLTLPAGQSWVAGGTAQNDTLGGTPTVPATSLPRQLGPTQPNDVSSPNQNSSKNDLPIHEIVGSKVSHVSAQPVISDPVVNPPASPAPSRKTMLQLAVLFIWMIGVLAVITRTLLGLTSARRLLSGCRPIASRPVTEATDQVRKSLRVGRHVRVLEGISNSGVVVPMTCGVIHPAILLPSDATEWPDDRLRVVLLHEMAHVRRFDWLLMLAAQFVCALYWFNPLVWAASSRLRAESEGACDDMVLSCGVLATDYAGHLLEIVRRIVQQPAKWQATVAMAHRPEVTDRVHAILTPDRKRGVLAGRVLIVSALLLMFFVGSLAALRPAPAAWTAPTTTGHHDASTIPSQKSAVVASGAAVQGRFTLLTVTSIAQKGPVSIPSSVIPTGVDSTGPIMADGGGTGLWIGVQGGIGFRNLPLPATSGRHSYTFGKATLVVNGTANSFSTNWTGPGATLIATSEQPYQISWTATTDGRMQATLIPRNLWRHFHITAQSQSSFSKPLGQPVSLVCQPVSANVFFVQIPTGYDAATRQMQVTVAAEGSKGDKASWRLTGLPQSVQSGKPGFSPMTTAAYGPVVLRAAAVESEDLSGDPGTSNEHPVRPAGGQWFFQPPSNADGHGWTGVPTIRFMLRGMNTSKDFYGQDWMVRLSSVTPEWQTSPAMTVSKQVTPLDVFPLYNRENLRPEDHGVQELAWQVGVAYPGQQHWVRIDGEMLHYVKKVETVTFHNAEVVQDKLNGVNRLVWSTPETETTPSGISISVLNERDGKLDFTNAASGGQSWRFQNTNVPVLIAWNMPNNFVQALSTLDAPHEAYPPELAGTRNIFQDNPLPEPGWQSLATPGETDARSLLRSGYLPLCLPMDAAASPQTSLSFNSTEPVVVAPASPPQHIKSIKVQVWIRELKESHPFHLMVPVQSSFPAGWDPHAGESRSSMP